MTWGSIILAVLKIANILLQYSQQQRWISTGEDRQLAKSALELISRLSSFKEIEEEYSKKTEIEVRKDIEDKGDFRD